MLQINGLTEGLDIFKTLGSQVRLGIVQLLAERGEMNLNEIAGALSLTNGALTAHIRKLQECGIIRVTQDHSGKGNQKRCSLAVREILLNVRPAAAAGETHVYETAIRIGHYAEYTAGTPCGLAGADGMIGQENVPAAFAAPDHVHAQLLWMGGGSVTYQIPNILPKGQVMTELMISMEVSSALYGDVQGRQSDIAFYLNEKKLGSWLSVEESDGTRGIYTPIWWDSPARRHGFLKMFVINSAGVYLDGLKISDRTIRDWEITDHTELMLRIDGGTDSVHCGGLALYGAGFGNYQQDLFVRAHYSPAVYKGA